MGNPQSTIYISEPPHGQIKARLDLVLVNSTPSPIMLTPLLHRIFAEEKSSSKSQKPTFLSYSLF